MKHFIFTTLTMIGLAAQPLTAETLDQCQQLAQQNYPLIRKYDLIQQTSQYTVQNLNRGWLPQLSLNAQATLQSDVVSLPDALQNMMTAQGLDIKGLKKDQYKIALDLQQVIYDGGAISSQKEVARRQSDVQSAQADVDLYQVRDRINNLYFGILLTQERIRLNDASLKLISSNVRKLEDKLSEGVAMQCDVNALRAEALNLQQRDTELQSTLATLQQMINVFCGKQVSCESAALQTGLPTGLSSGLSTDGSAVCNGAAGNTAAISNGAEEPTPGDTYDARPELRLLDRQSSLISAQRKALDAQALPKVSLFAQGFYGYPGYNMYDDMFSHDWSLNGMVGIRLNWNISSLYTRQGDLHKLRLQQDQLQNARDVFNFNTSLQQTQEQRYADRCRKLMQQDDQIISLRQSVREASEAKLEDGIIDVNNLLQEITREEQARIAKVQHQIEYEQHMAELKYIMGDKD